MTNFEIELEALVEKWIQRGEDLNDMLATMRQHLEDLEAYQKAHWRCFHCGDTFTFAQKRWAQEHFGRDQDQEPVCLIRSAGESALLSTLRKAESELAYYRSEDTALLRAIGLERVPRVNSPYEPEDLRTILATLRTQEAEIGRLREAHKSADMYWSVDCDDGEPCVGYPEEVAERIMDWDGLREGVFRVQRAQRLPDGWIAAVWPKNGKLTVSEHTTEEHAKDALAQALHPSPTKEPT